MRSKSKAFIDGLVKPSELSLVVAVLTSIVLCCFYFSFSDPTNIIENASLLATDERDDDIFITSTVLQLKAETAPLESIYLIGDSALREIVRVNLLTDELKRNNFDARIVDLRGGGQSLLESLAIIDNLPDNSTGLVVLGISAKSFIINSKMLDSASYGNRRGYTSEALMNFLDSIGHRSNRTTGVYGIDNFRFLLPRFINYWFSNDQRRTERSVHLKMYAAKKSTEELNALKNTYSLELSLPYKKYRTFIDTGLKALSTTINIVESKPELKITFIEKPLSPDFLSSHVGKEFITAYENLIIEFTEKYNVTYHNPSHYFPYNSADFYDLVHVRKSPTSSSYTSHLARLIMDSKIIQATDHQ